MAATLGPSPWSFSCHSHVRRSLLFNLKPLSSSSPGGPERLPDPKESPEAGPSPSPPVSLDPVKLAFERAKAYKNTSRPQHQPPAVDEIATDRAGASLNGADEEVGPGLKESSGVGLGKLIPGKETSKERLVISNIDFLGLDFADKKQTRGLPPGLVPISDPFPEGEDPDVEIIVGDASKFDNSKALTQVPVQEGDSDLYKPQVTSWGMFPRPSNISKTFGGGRVIHPGDMLETTEDRAAKDARTRELLAAYKKKMGLTIDAKLKSECEKALKDGDSLMNVGKLKEALPFYEQIMGKLPFQSELYGLAALQWSICQDSLTRPKDARVMYEKLESHPNARISKKARQFMFSFEAMEMMKVRSSRLSSAESTGFRDYFEAFVKEKSEYTLNKNGLEGGSLSQVFPYVVFLLSPIFAVLILALYK